MNPIIRELPVGDPALPLEGAEPWLSAARVLVAESGVEVFLWTRERGCAYLSAADGRWWIETPRPATPRSFWTFAHEVGHHMLHRSRAPRWREEIEAHRYALDQFDRFALPGADGIRGNILCCVSYAISKGVRHARDPIGMLDEALAYAGEKGLRPPDDDRWVVYLRARYS